jgi:hypothetical protein
MESRSEQSRKLFDSGLVTNNFPILKKSLTPGHKKCIFSVLGKFRTGKSTLMNIIISLVEKKELRKIFKQLQCPISVTNGADFYIYSDTVNKIDYVFIDCEGSGNYNSSEVMKLYLLIACISDAMFFNVDKALDDQTLNDFICPVISQLEMLKIKVPEIHLLYRDVERESLENFLRQNITDENLLRITAARTYLSNCPFSRHIPEKNIHFISTPEYRRKHITDDVTSDFYKDIVKVYTSTFGSLPKSQDTEEKEKRLKLLWTYDISKLNQTEFSSFITNLVNKTLNDNYSSQIESNKQTVTGYNNCVNALNTKKNNYLNFVKNHLSSVLLTLDENVSNLINQYINQKINTKLTELSNSYNTSRNNYIANRENSSQQQPYYRTESYQEPNTTYTYEHKGYVETYCSSCNGLFNHGGCTPTYQHSGTTTIHRRKVLFFTTEKWWTWTCCGESSHNNHCSNSPNHHPGSVRKWTGCLCAEGNSGCNRIAHTNYRSATKQVVAGYSKVYTMSDWNENMFSYSI